MAGCVWPVRAIRNTPMIATATTEKVTSDVDTTDPMVAAGGVSPRRRRWSKVALVVSGVILLVAVTARTIRLPYDTIAPGSALPVDSEVVIKDHAVFPPHGSLLSVTVAVRERVNPYEALAGWVSSDVDIVPDRTVRGTVPPRRFEQLNVEAMADSKTSAEVAALRRIGITDLGGGARVVDVQAGLPGAAVLSPGDVIVGVDDKPVTTSEEAVAVLKAHKAGDRLGLAVQKGGADPVSQVTAVLGHDDAGAPRLGVRLMTKIRLPFPITINSGNVVGPSAGLAYGLELLDVLTPGELTGGRRVAVTGELASDGSVSAIGGVAQKAVTVRRAGVKVFLVPKDNFAEAKAHAGDDLKVYPVESIDDALRVLGRLGGSNASGFALGAPAKSG